MDIVSIIKMAKSIKRPYIKITPNYILGGDQQISMLSIIFFPEPQNIITNFVGTVHELEDKTRPDELFLSQIDIDCKFNYMMNQILSFEKSTPLYNGVLNEDDTFTELMSMKTTQGSKFYHIMNNVMATSKTLHPINKSDVVTVTTYRYDEVSFLAYFTITKKGYIIHEYIRYLYL